MISACIIARNEEANIPRLIESLRECDEIIIGDGGSTDKTVEIATSLGAHVYERERFEISPTLEDVDAFTSLFGYTPSFTTETIIRDAARERNELIKKAKNDWIFYPDADEFVSWDMDVIRELMQQHDSIECRLMQTRDGKQYNYITKLFDKSKTRWSGKIHEVIYKAKRSVRTDSMVIDHFQKQNSQSGVKAVLEYLVLREKTSRYMFYLGREYFYYKEYQRAIDIFMQYIESATWRPEAAHAFLLMAKCAWKIQQGKNAREWCLRAISINPDFREALADMATYTGDGQSKYWKRMSEGATDNDVLFRTVPISR